MKKRSLLIAAVVFGAGSLFAVSASAHNLTAQKFVHKASIANEFEIESSKLALDKSENSDVKDLAKRMIDDHEKTGDKLKDVLDSANIDAKPADELDSKHQKILDELKAASADKFDDEYLSAQTDAHKEAINLFSNYAKNGKEAKLQKFAEQTLPTLKDHLKHVRKVKSDK